MRDHGGNLDAAIATYGGNRADWIDLSTGINPRPYPLPKIPPSAWSALPTRQDLAGLTDIAALAYRCDVEVLPVAGAQAAIQVIPRLVPAGTARILDPTYNEHAAALNAAGWRVEPVAGLAALAGADLAVVVNPNNPDGRRHDPNDLATLAHDVATLVVDESFADTHPELSCAGEIGDGTIILRSFGKFYGLAGLRLGFMLAGARHHESLRALVGPWPVSGPAIRVGTTALRDAAWHRSTVERLALDAARIDQAAIAAGWSVVGGTSLFRLYETGDAAAAQKHLAQARIWSRVFPYSRGWIRLGLPDGSDQWDRVEAALLG